MIDIQRLSTRYGRLSIFVVLTTLLLLATAVAAQEPVLPTTSPDAGVGLTLFADRCANCHGPAGQGDGEMAARLEKPPANYTDPEFRRTRIPADMFVTITDGRLEGGMPPFGPANQTNPINETNRWDLVAAVYSLATPPEAVELGQTIYEENCAACHGDTGLGDGPDAAAQETPPTDLTDLAYWYNRSNEDVFNGIANQGIPAHDYELTDDERWAAVDYGRTFSYRYVQPGVPPEPIAAATISGTVTNATNGDLITEGEVVLRAFDANFQPMMTMTNTIGADGSYVFDLTDVQPNWVFLVSTTYNDIGFSSDAARVEQINPALTLPVTVFETTSDPAVVIVDQIHILLNWSGDQLQVDEFYVFSNQGNSVFVGETGDPGAGTLQISLPEGAENVSFQRALGSMDSTIPANEIIQTADGWADTFPLNPGPSGLNLIVSYDLPYSDGASLSRPVHYQVTNANVILPEAGVTVAGDGLEDLGVQDMGGSRFATYNRANVSPDSVLTLTLDGRPQLTTPTGSTVQPGNNSLDLIIGGISLLIVGGLAFFTVRTWRSRSEDEEEDDLEDEKEQLLQAIVDLDETFDKGQIGEAEYTSRRAELKTALAEIWE